MKALEARTQGYHGLIVHKKADELAFQVYQTTKNFPKDEIFAMVSQMRRAVVSVPANIAEGYTRKGSKDKVHFYNIAQGSLIEVEYFLEFSLRLGYIKEDDFVRLINLKDEVGRLLYVFIQKTK